MPIVAPHATALNRQAVDPPAGSTGARVEDSTLSQSPQTNASPLGLLRRFEILRCLGAGGMGVVYEAIDRDRHLHVALKTMRSFSPEGLLRFKREFRLLSNLRHPNLVTLGELLEERGQWFFTMELICGVDFLTDVRTPAVDEPRLRQTLRGIAEGLDYLHRAGLVHRDIKPSNLLVTPEGRAVLLDFGLIFDAAGGERIVPGIGTRAYMAPEQAEGGCVTAASDCYSVGVLLHEVLVGSRPETPLVLNKHAGSTELVTLCAALLDPDPHRRPTATDIIAWLDRGDATAPGPALRREAPPPTRTAAFFGRTAELHALRAQWQEVRNGHGQAVLVRGESGIGKSALVVEFERLLRHDEPGLLTLVGRCAARESVPFKAFDGIVDGIAKHLEEQLQKTMPLPSTNVLAILAHTFPVLGRVGFATAPPTPHNSDLDPREQRLRLFGAMREVLRFLAERQPLLLIVEDLHWADADSMALLTEVLREPGRPSLLLVRTQRTAAGGGSTSPLVDAGVLELGCMSEADAEALATHDLGPRASPEIARAIVLEANGHPFFTAELSRYVGTSWSGLPSEKQRAELFRTAIESRFDRLETGAARVLALVAIADAPVPMPLLADAGAQDSGPLLPHLAALECERLVQRIGPNGDALEPYHDRIRELIVARLDPSARRACHRCLAETFEAAMPDAAEALAVHWQGAGDATRAVAYAERAAARAVEKLAFAQGARFYRMALDLLPTTASQRFELIMRLAEALALVGHGAEAAEAFLAAAAYEPMNSAAARKLEWRAADQFLRSGHVSRGLELSRRVLEEVGVSLPTTAPGMIVAYVTERARVRLRGTNFKRREEHEVAADDLRRLDVIWPVICGLLTCEPVRAGDLMARYFRWALDTGEPYRIMRALSAEAGFAALSGPSGRQRAARLIEQARGIAINTDGTWARGGIAMASGVLALSAGELSHALSMFNEAETSVRSRRPAHLTTRAAEALDITWELDMPCVYGLITLLLLGDLERLTERVSALGAEARERGDRFLMAHVGFRAVEVHLARDDLAAARRSAREVLDGGFPLTPSFDLVALNSIDLYADDGCRAYERICDAWSHLARTGMLSLEAFRISLLHHRGFAAVDAAHRMSGIRRRRLIADAESMARGLAAINIPTVRGHPFLIRAGIAQLVGDGSRAIALLTHAQTCYESADMRLYAAAARLRRGQLMRDNAGKEIASEAHRALQDYGVRAPERFAAVLAPMGGLDL